MTEEQQALVDALVACLEREPGIEALWVAGSLGAGHGDAYSDVDLLALAGPDGWAALSAKLQSDLVPALDVVLLNPLFGGRVLNAVTADWGRFDITLVERDGLARYDARVLTPLFNRGDAGPPTKADVPYRTSPERLTAMASEFLRVLGLAPVSLGRKEYVLALTVIDIQRRAIVELMHEENGLAPDKRGGALHPNRHLTDEQKAALAALPHVIAEPESIAAGDLALARLFLARARPFAERIGAAWPQAFEEATRKHLRQTLGWEI